MGLVYRAKQLSLHRLVALKMILSARLATEPKGAARIGKRSLFVIGALKNTRAL